jgi:cytochrome P450 family 77 subfamily A
MMWIDSTDLILFISAAILAVLWWHSCQKANKGTDGLPPGPPGWPIVGNLVQVILQRRPFMYVVGDLRKKYGPIFTLKMGARTMVIISSSDLIHEALIKRGPSFANRPPDSPTRLLFSCGKCTVNSAHYGPIWRTLRRNFVGELVTPTRIKQFSWIRGWAMSNHFERLRAEYHKTGCVQILANCRLTVCSILCCICFGMKVPESHVKEIEQVLKEVMLISTLKLPDFLPGLGFLFRKEFSEAKKLRKRQMDCLLPLVQARRAFVRNGGKVDNTRYLYVPISDNSNFSKFNKITLKN